jgi:hypothetical protein
MVAATHAAGHAAASGLGTGPSGMGDNGELIIVLMVISTGLVFIDHDRSGKPQSGNQYIAIGVVGFFLLLLSNFWPEMALAMAALFTVSIVLNTPNGVPFISSGAPTGPTGQPLQPGQTGFGVVAPGHSVNAQGVAQ